MEIRQATLDEFDGVMALLRANHVDNLNEAERKDGFVTTNMTPAQMTALIAEENGVTVALDGDKVTAFALAAPWTFWSQWPFFQNMIRILGEYRFEGVTLTEENSYQYRPVCVDRSYRGRGLFERVFAASLRTMEDRYPIMATFVNQANPRSYAAHSRRVGMGRSGVVRLERQPLLPDGLLDTEDRKGSGHGTFHSNLSLYILPHVSIATMIGRKVVPNSLSAYSTRGGTSG